MIDRFYRDLIDSTVDGNDLIHEEFKMAMGLIWLLDKLDVVKVSMGSGGLPHNYVVICIDGKVYTEDIDVWLNRFKQK